MEKRYFVRKPDNKVECLDNIPSGCDINLIKKRHILFNTREEAENWAREFQNTMCLQIFKECGLNESYGYSLPRPTHSPKSVRMGN